MSAGSPPPGSPEYFALACREYFELCEYSPNERPPDHAHFKNLLLMLKSAYGAGHENGEAVADDFWRKDSLCPVHLSLDSQGHLEYLDNCVFCTRNQRNELRDSVIALLDLIERGVLIRDTSKDAEIGWALHQLPLINVLQKAQAAIGTVQKVCEDCFHPEHSGLCDVERGDRVNSDGVAIAIGPCPCDLARLNAPKTSE